MAGINKAKQQCRTYAIKQYLVEFVLSIFYFSYILPLFDPSVFKKKISVTCFIQCVCFLSFGRAEKSHIAITPLLDWQ